MSTLETAIEALRAAAATVAEQLEETGERVAMPNSRRAEQQLRTALNAAHGARRSLRRRLELSRGGRPED